MWSIEDVPTVTLPCPPSWLIRKVSRQVEEKQIWIEFLEKKVRTKDEVLAELMAEHVALKKVPGNSDRQLSAA